MKVLGQWLLFLFVLAYLASCGAARRAEIGSSKNGHSPGAATADPHGVISEARRYLGTPYVYAGKEPGGFDCSGFTRYVMRSAGVELPGNSGMQEQTGRPVSADRARPGDLVFFRRSKRGKVFHVGLITERGPDVLRIIHSTSSRGVVEIEILGNSYWGPMIRTYRRVW